jgi:tetratricopeptide (TPR) repeat protein
VATPAGAQARYNQGVALEREGRHLEAASAFRAALAVDRFYRAALRGLGLSLQNLGRLRQAKACYGACLRRDPADVPAWVLLGTAFQKERRYDEALAAYRTALSLDPQSIDAGNNLGSALQCARRWDEAKVVLGDLVSRRPDFAEGWNNLGLVLGLLDDLGPAEAALRQALKLNPRHGHAWRNLGNVLLYACRVDEAIGAYRAAYAAEPAMDSARNSESVALLLAGNLADGWRAYEHRYAARSAQELERFAGARRWRGEPLAGCRIMVHAEQGLGDMIHFARYLPLLAARGAEVHVELPASLRELLGGMPGVRATYAQGEALPAFDFNCPMMSLPLAFGTTLESIPCQVPYLVAPEADRSAWLARIPPGPGRRIGVIWAGSSLHENDHRRSIGLARFQRLFEAHPHDQFFCLQKARSKEDAAVLGEFDNVTDLAPFLGTFADSASAIARLDLVITVDTSVAHLAGALGVPFWVLLPFSPDWRWLLNRPDSPWYPSATLIRQRQPGDWESVLSEVASRLVRTAAQ